MLFNKTGHSRGQLLTLAVWDLFHVRKGSPMNYISIDICDNDTVVAIEKGLMFYLFIFWVNLIYLVQCARVKWTFILFHFLSCLIIIWGSTP